MDGLKDIFHLSLFKRVASRVFKTILRHFENIYSADTLNDEFNPLTLNQMLLVGNFLDSIREYFSEYLEQQILDEKISYILATIAKDFNPARVDMVKANREFEAGLNKLARRLLKSKHNNPEVFSSTYQSSFSSESNEEGSNSILDESVFLSSSSEENKPSRRSLIPRGPSSKNLVQGSNDSVRTSSSNNRVNRRNSGGFKRISPNNNNSSGSEENPSKFGVIKVTRTTSKRRHHVRPGF
eukprot:TRINITY_DN3959_c0_g2_i1.p1 TRINITY_DN3959_c0_g2~~TRINITY_DN3959_c0_g2_i1.p1  ORF type:complete len:275 (+),score=56.01 TRINITY_DN3959_c0_g2_i1:108-827(+)